MAAQHRRVVRRCTRYTLAIGWGVLSAVTLIDWVVPESLIPDDVDALALSALITGSLTYSISGMADRVVHRIAAVSGHRQHDDPDDTGAHIATIYQLGKHAGERGIGS